MEAILKPEGYKDIAIMGPDSFARQGIATLLLEMGIRIRIKASVRDYEVLQMVFDKWHIDLLLISVSAPGQPGFNCLEFVNQIKSEHPEIVVCLYSAEISPLLWLRSGIDAWFSLKDSVQVWQANLLKIIRSQHHCKTEIPPPLLLTQSEWGVLKAIKSGNSLSNIALKEKISYRRASALKSSAIRKLGLRNKTDLLVFLSH